LIDFAAVHAGHWVEDAIYFEHLLWANPQRLGDQNIARMISLQRKQEGLPGESDWPDLANIRRVLLAAAAPAYMRSEGDPRYTSAALNVLERTLSQVN
jgi:hypothetical protein